MLRSYRKSWLPASIARYFLLAFTTFLLVTGCSSQSTQINSPQVEKTTASSKKLEVINIGHQSGTPGLNLLKAQGYLEKRFAPDGITIKWIEFRGGPPMMEAMAANSVDIGNVGNLPPIFAQAGDNPIVYVAATGSSAGAQAVIVRKDSPIKTLAELKGKKVAIQKGTALQYLLLKAIASAGLTLNDIQPAYLTIPESQVAFEGGKVDVLPTSDPFYARKELANEIRVLVKGSDVAPQRAYYIATRNFAENHPDLVKVILSEQRKVEEWAKANPNEVTKLLAAQTRQQPEVWKWALERRPIFGVFDITDEFVTEQQHVVDLFYSQKLIPKTFKVKDAVWKPKS